MSRSHYPDKLEESEPPSVDNNSLGVLRSAPGAAADCGRQGLHARIFGGDRAIPGEWPWHATLSFNGKPFCGGSLISEKWLLTAAHCFESTATEDKRDPTQWRVHLGVTRMGYEPEENSAVTIRPSKIVIHDSYVNYIQGYDIALVELSIPVTFTRFISPVCLPKSTHRFNLRSTCYATGLQDVPDGVPLDSQRSLQKVSQTLIGWKTCNCIYNSHKSLDVSSPAKASMLCIVDTFGHKGPCLGDSGGPVVCNEEGVWFLAGAISFSQGCHLQDNPTILTSASFYQNWIQQSTDSSATFSDQSSTVTVDEDNDTCSDLLSNLTSGCGYSDIETFGSVSPGPWPWQVDLWKEDQRACGGALISTNWVITAAQCFVGLDPSDSPSDWSVTVASGTQAMRQLAVQKISIHGSYITPEQGSNVALVQLSMPAPLGPYTEPICLPQSSHKIPYNSSCWFSGNDGDQPGAKIQSSRGVKMDLVGPNQCNCIYSRPNSDHPSISILPGMICATRPENIGDQCLNDFGGPLACRENKTWFLIGVQSFRGGCDTLLPEVFTDLTQYESWIFRETRDAAFRPQLDTRPPELDTDRCSYNSPRACGRSVTSPAPGSIDGVTEKTWPWQVSVQLYGSHVCSGVLIAETWFLIAAHCMPRYTTISEYTVSLSRQFQDKPNPREVTRKIKRVVPYPGYKAKTGEDDLALVEMFYGITFSDYIMPICLTDEQSTFPPTKCWVSGWGRLHPTDSISSTLTLRHLEVSLLDMKNCGAQENIIQSGGRLCVAGKRDNTLTCLMDSSAPLVCQPKPGGPWLLYGITSQSSPPKKNSCPGNFTIVMSKLAWIREVVPRKDLSYLDSIKTNDSVPSSNTTSVPPPLPSTTPIPHTANTTYGNVTIKTGGPCPGNNMGDGVTCTGHTATTPHIVSSTTKDGNQRTNSTTGSGAESLWWDRSTHCILLLLSFSLCR
ncbi:serine protease 53-like [Hyla sarda]|uniref:serine protease 53-like n=1 Tax=Hyla sarda TaxID=327740 RepID=UPI0024C28B9B|nr:serine protease 53-like [Hyla sarda]